MATGTEIQPVPLDQYGAPANFTSRRNRDGGMQYLVNGAWVGRDGMPVNSGREGGMMGKSSAASGPAAGITPLAPMAKPPSYEQFAQKFAARPSPIMFNGQGGGPMGMNPQDATMLQKIYAPIPATPSPAPARAAGGFIPQQPGGFLPQPFATGGAPAGMGAWFTRKQASESVHDGGLFDSKVPGRTDKLNTMVPAGAYVIPADVVSGLGEGNTMAGAAILGKMFHSMPFGMQEPRLSGGGTMPSKSSSSYKETGNENLAELFKGKFARGGATNKIPIIAAGGEFLVTPEAVRKLGGGDMKKGHKILDSFVVTARKKTTNEMKKLPGPKK